MFVTSPTFSKITRWTFGALALCVSLFAHATLGIAGTATLIMPDTCQDPVSSFNYQWSVDKFGSSALFYMDGTGAVSELSTTGKTLGDADFDTVYIVAHGSSTDIGGIVNGTFATKLKSAYTGTPSELFFAACCSADNSSSSGSLLKQVSAAFSDNINKLSGGKSNASLTDNGTPVLQKAVFKDAVTRTQSVLWKQIVANVRKKWAGTDTAGTTFPSTSHSYEAECKAHTTGTFSKSGILNLIAKVNSNFATSPGSSTPASTSTNYFDLIMLNDGGSAMTECGKNPTGAGVVACP